MVKDRGERKPLQYITGTAFFRELALFVGPGVLVPRPETELLAERVINRIKETAAARILDWGTGSGCIALSLLKETGTPEIVGLDRSGTALEYCKKNCGANLGDSSRVRWITSDTIDASLGKFDIIVSNPPYIPSSEIDTLQPEVRFEPREALDGGADGLDFYRMFNDKSPLVLNPGGWIFLEIGFKQKDPVTDLFFSSGKWNYLEFYNDLAGIPRILKARLKD
jgi:release factor glutamine methyltransferase